MSVNKKTLESIRGCKNNSLYFNKFLIQKEITERNKETIFNDCVRTFPNNTRELGKYKDRMQSVFMKQKGLTTIVNKEFELKTYLLVGAGNSSAYDVGMTLSRNYGFPVIPGQAIKGAFSHYIYEELDDDSILNERYKELFGTDSDGDHIRGGLIFTEAYPISYTMGIDIVNNHFQSYYMKENKPPNDWYVPIPVTYLVVDSGSKFMFNIFFQGNIEKNLKEEVSNEFSNFLRDYGLGSKTAYSYGMFE